MKQKVKGRPARGSVMLIDASRMFRDGLKHLLLEAGFDVIAEGRSVAETQVGTDNTVLPDLVIVSFASDSDLNAGFSDINGVRASFPQARVVVLTAQMPPPQLLRILHMGAAAILTRDMSGAMLQSSLDLVMQGQQLFPASVTHMLLGEEAAASGPAAVPVPPAESCPAHSEHQPGFGRPTFPLGETKPPSCPGPGRIMLSEREGQILQCLVRGFSNKAMARELSISEPTVKVHVKGLLRKLHANNRTQVAIWALNNMGVPQAPTEPPLRSSNIRVHPALPPGQTDAVPNGSDAHYEATDLGETCS